MKWNAIQDRVRGTLLGLAAGDRNGGPIRFATRLAESLLDRDGFDPDDVRKRYAAWWREGACDTGAVAALVLDKISKGVSPEEATLAADEELGGRTAGCNPAHRCPPLAAAAFLSDRQLSAAAKTEAALTHRHPLAGEVSAAAVELCRAMIQGTSWRQATALIRSRTSPWLSDALDPEAETPLRRDGFSPNVLRAAAWFLSRQSNFPDALNASLDFAGPANYCPVIVGSLAGARWGASAIPSDAFKDAETQALVGDLADRMAFAWNHRPPE
ncbi:MAG: ADP-ribosylglycohydrolase family protein [Planctomycetales bacterium]